MYKKAFGLKENPFNVTPDPRFLYATPHTEEALACLKYCVQARKGFVMLTGDVGTGKTTLLNKLLEILREEQVASAYVFNPRLNPFQFLDYAMSDFGVNCQTRLKSVILAELNNWLIARHQSGSTAVLVVDEAQDASPELLEEIRLLTNLELPSGKLLQIVLAGQQELEMKLRLPEFRQLRQRITLRAKTHPLTPKETKEYIATRLRIAGSDGRQIFSPEAVDTIHKYSEGIPRIINILCEDSLIATFADHKAVVPKETVEDVARELELDLYPATAPLPVETRLDDLVQAGVYVNRAKPAIPSLEPPSEDPPSYPVRPPAQAERPLRGGPPPTSPPPLNQSLQPKVTKPGAVALPPTLPPALPLPRKSVAAVPPTETAGTDNNNLGRALATTTPVVSPAASDSSAPPAEGATTDDEILQVLRSKPVPTKPVAPAPSPKPPAVTPPPRPPASRPVFTAATKPASPNRVLWFAITAVLLGGAGGAFLIWWHTGQPTAPAGASGPSVTLSAVPEALNSPEVGSQGHEVSGPATTPPPAAEASPEPPPGAPSTPKPEPVAQPKPEQPVRRSRPAAPPVAAPTRPPAVGKAVITASVEGARITVDGRSLADWVAPHVFPDLSEGTHTVMVSKPGYEDVSTRMTIREGETSYFRAILTEGTGDISIITEPPGLPVSFDGGPFRPSPAQVTLKAGPHKYQIRLPNSKVYEGSVEMRAGSIITRRVDFSGGEWLNPNE